MAQQSPQNMKKIMRVCWTRAFGITPAKSVQEDVDAMAACFCQNSKEGVLQREAVQDALHTLDSGVP